VNKTIGNEDVVFIDEMGRRYNGRNDTSEFDATLDSMFQRGRKTPRTGWGKNGRELELLECFSPLCFSGKTENGEGQFPDSLFSRSFKVWITKRDPSNPHEALEPFISMDVRPIYERLCVRLHEYLEKRKCLIGQFRPEMPKGAEDRFHDKWFEAMIGMRLLDLKGEHVSDVSFVSDVSVKGRWEEQCWEDIVAELPIERQDIDQQSLDVRMFRNLVDIIETTPDPKYSTFGSDWKYDFKNNHNCPTRFLYDELMAFPEGGWDYMPDTRRPLTQSQMIKRLDKLGVKRPGEYGSVRAGPSNEPVKGFDLFMWYDTIRRYYPEKKYLIPSISGDTADTVDTADTELVVAIDQSEPYRYRSETYELMRESLKDPKLPAHDRLHFATELGLEAERQDPNPRW